MKSCYRFSFSCVAVCVVMALALDCASQSEPASGLQPGISPPGGAVLGNHQAVDVIPPSWPSQTAASGPAAQPVPAAPAAEYPQPIQRVEPQVAVASPGLAELVQLAQSGTDESVILQFVRQSQIPYSPTAEEIVYLRDMGLSSAVITAVIERGQELMRQSIAVVPAPAPARPQVVPTAPTMSALAAPVVMQEQPAAVYSEPAQPAAVSYFYNQLAPYGAWIEIPGYGWCWQPSAAVAQPAWQPYWDNGRWLYSDCGWYWNSYYSWGWAPFHYGRWWRHGTCGWLWSPGLEWGPSWVTWRQHRNYCGWAPLPPGARYHGGGWSYNGMAVGVSCDFGLGALAFSWVSYDRVCDPHPYRHRPPPHEMRGIHHDSHVVNDYAMGPNRTVINKGLGRERIAHLSRSDIRTVEVRDLPATAGRGIRPDRLERSGSSMVVYRPGAPAGERNSAISPKTGRGGESRGNIAGSDAGRSAGIGHSNPGGSPRVNPVGTIGRSSATAATTPFSGGQPTSVSRVGNNRRSVAVVPQAQRAVATRPGATSSASQDSPSAGRSTSTAYRSERAPLAASRSTVPTRPAASLAAPRAPQIQAAPSYAGGSRSIRSMPSTTPSSPSVSSRASAPRTMRSTPDRVSSPPSVSTMTPRTTPSSPSVSSRASAPRTMRSTPDRVSSPPSGSTTPSIHSRSVAARPASRSSRPYSR